MRYSIESGHDIGNARNNGLDSREQPYIRSYPGMGHVVHVAERFGIRTSGWHGLSQTLPGSPGIQDKPDFLTGCIRSRCKQEIFLF